MKSEAILDRCGITYRQLDHWCRRGYITPRDRRKDTSGIPRDFTDDELAVAALMGRLIDRGFTAAAAAKIARAMVDTNGYIKLGQGITLHIREVTS